MTQRVRQGYGSAWPARPAAVRAPRSAPPHEQVLEIQRSRLLGGALAAVQQQGYAAAMVGSITRQAKVSRRTFYEIFENREACLAALIKDILGSIEGDLARADLTGLAWREQVRGGLWEILCFFEREPALARLLIVESAGGGPQVQELREQALARLANVIDGGRERAGARAAECSALTAEGLVGAALGIVHKRLVHPRPESLSGLLGELVGMIVLPYLGPAAARAERTRGLPRTRVSETSPLASSAFAGSREDPLQTLPMRLTYRTVRVLQCIECQPGASNRDVADAAGVRDPGQISKLLARLERLGLLENRGQGAHVKGEPNAWELTPAGGQVVRRLRATSGYHGEQTATANNHKEVAS